MSTNLKTLALLLGGALMSLVASEPAMSQTQSVSVVVMETNSAALPSRFLGLSYETSMLLAQNGHYYFDSNNVALVNLFKTLGIQSLRVGANAVDDPRIPVPQEKDIDELFNFARVTGVKVIYSFRLKKGDPAEAARLARYITDHDADVLDCFSIGNEPHLFPAKSYDLFFKEWKPIYDAIVQAIPGAMFDAPSANAAYTLHLVKDVFADGHLAMASDHYYFLGSGRAAETNAPASRARFLSDRIHTNYVKDYAELGAKLAVQGVPYRIDEMNSCYNGGARDSSDTYASTLWALDCTHWWAAHHILGVNYHTGESVGRDGKFGPPNYAAFLRQVDGQGFAMRPQGYAYLAFSQGAHGRPLNVKIKSGSMFDFDAYAYRDADGSFYLTLINKSYGDKAQMASVSCKLPAKMGPGTWQKMDLTQADHDIAAKTGVTLAGAEVDSQGMWSGQWAAISAKSSKKLAIPVPAASATILRFLPSK